MKKKSLSYKILILLSYFVMSLFIICLTSVTSGNADQFTPIYSSGLFNNYSLLGIQGAVSVSGLSSPFAPGSPYFQPSAPIQDPNRSFSTNITNPSFSPLINYSSGSFQGTGIYSGPSIYAGVSGLYGDIPSLYGGIPSLYGGIPSLYGGIPSLYGGIPSLYGGIPSLYGGISSLYGGISGIPSLYGGISGLYGGMPDWYGGSGISTYSLPSMTARPYPSCIACPLSQGNISPFNSLLGGSLINIDLGYTHPRNRIPPSSPPAF